MVDYRHYVENPLINGDFNHRESGVKTEKRWSNEIYYFTLLILLILCYLLWRTPHWFPDKH
jgi:hypothetical protein